ncbi:hypothetical protein PLCT1_01495 [Planctomycetaceae bacterium]|nr:hypothetical protein PLCT1_01495 [Planctomycetaceae bacterium]
MTEFVRFTCPPHVTCSTPRRVLRQLFGEIMRIAAKMGLLALLVALCAAPLLAGESATGVKWETDYKKGLEAAVKANKPMFIEFTAEW